MLRHTVFISTFIFLLIFKKVSSADCVLDTGPSDTQYEIQLQKDLLANYSHREPPNKSNTVVAVKFKLRNFKFLKNEATFNIYSWLYFHWEDPRFQWNPDDYGGIDKTVLHKFVIWNPIGFLTNLGNAFNSDKYYHNTYCLTTNTGHAMCVLRIIHETVCAAKLFDWPYDYQICTFTFGIRKGAWRNITFTFNGTSGISAIGAEYGTGWDIMDFKAGENTKGDVKLYLKFVAERQAVGIAVMIVIPLILVAFMTVSSMFLDIRDMNRLSLLSFSLFGHFMVLNNISDNVPHYGANIPGVLLFAKSSLLITLSFMLLTIILTFLTKRPKKCYEWIELVNDNVLRTRFKLLLFLKWQVKDSESSEPKDDSKKWIDFANIVNCFYTTIVIFIYIILYAVYIPKPIPMDQEYDI